MDYELLLFENRLCSRAPNGFDLGLYFVAASTAGELTDQINDIDLATPGAFFFLFTVLRIYSPYLRPILHP
jgi:hypothetical protein